MCRQRKKYRETERSNEISLVTACDRNKNAFIYRSWIFNRLRSIWATTTTTTNVRSRLQSFQWTWSRKTLLFSAIIFSRAIAFSSSSFFPFNWAYPFTHSELAVEFTHNDFASVSFCFRRWQPIDRSIDSFIMEPLFHRMNYRIDLAWEWAMTIQLTANLAAPAAEVAVMAMDHHGHLHHVAMMIIHSNRSVQGNAFAANSFVALYQHRHYCIANVNASKQKISHAVASIIVMWHYCMTAAMHPRRLQLHQVMAAAVAAAAALAVNVNAKSPIVSSAIEIHVNWIYKIQPCLIRAALTTMSVAMPEVGLTMTAWTVSRTALYCIVLVALVRFWNACTHSHANTYVSYTARTFCLLSFAVRSIQLALPLQCKMFPFYLLYSFSNLQRGWYGIHITYAGRILWTYLYIRVLWSVSFSERRFVFTDANACCCCCCCCFYEIFHLIMSIWTRIAFALFTYAMFTFIIGRCFFRGSGGTVNVLRISGTQGYPECGTQRVSIFQNRHSLTHFTCKLTQI